jgi:hypothetical protein
MNKPTLLALRDRRDEVIQRLSDSFAGDVLDLDTFENRTGLAHQATTLAELDELVADLEPLPPGSQRAALVKLQADPALDLHRPAHRRHLVVFSNLERRGNWVVPHELRTVSVFGNAELDFRQASFSSGTTSLRVHAVFGNISIIVPPNLAVECDGSSVFGSFADDASAVADPDRPTLRIQGAAVFGNVEVTTRLPGESERQARKRRKQEQRELERTARAALPPGRK